MTRTTGKSEHVYFTSGGLELEGVLCLPPTENYDRAVVVCHPHPLYGGSMENPVVHAIYGALREAGVPVLRFNFRGVEDSEGEFDGAGGEAADVIAAAGFLRKRVNERAHLCLAGYSFGGWAALMAADWAGAQAVAVVAPPVSFMDMADAGQTGAQKFFIHGARDKYCEPEDFAAWYETLPEPKRELPIEGADHFFAVTAPKAGLEVAKFLTEINL